MNSTNFQRTIKEFLIKSLEFILSTRCALPGAVYVSPQNMNPHLQIVIPETHNVRTLFPQLWTHDMDTPLHVFLELVRAVEGCHPLLMERWEFLFSPADRCDAPDTPHTYLKKSSIDLRALLLCSLQSPAYTEFRGQLAYRLCFQLDELLPWSTKAKPQDLLTVPKPRFCVKTPIGSLGARVQFWKTAPNPEVNATQIIPQKLGYRQRLISMETEETKENPEAAKEVFGSWSSSSHGSGHSTNSNLPFAKLQLCTKPKDQSESSNTLSQVVRKCILPDVGFTPLSPAVIAGSGISSDEELDSAGIEKHCADTEANEDAKVAMFSLKCERGMKGKLFTSPGCSVRDGILSLKQTLAGLKMTKEQLLEQQRGSLLA